MNKYGKLLNEGVTPANAAEFDVVTKGTTFEGAIVTQYGEDIADANGQVQKQVLRWANFKIVEWVCQPGDQKDITCTGIINAAVAAYNAKYPQYPIAENETLIWQ